MSTITVQVQIPEALRQLGLSDEDIRREVPVLLVLQRFRQGVISSGKAAQLLGLSRRDFLDLLARERLPVYDPDVQELADELKTLERHESDVQIPPGIQRSKEAFLRDLPELLDIGTNHNFVISRGHVVRWGGVQPEFLRPLGLTRLGGERLPRCEADLWLHSNFKGRQENPRDTPPYRLNLNEGIIIRPD